MKNILCFGDSNTWGYSPLDKSRHPIDRRWTGMLQQALGPEHRILEQGLNGRTTFKNEEGEDAKPMRSGSQALPMILESQRPLDLVIVMLGTNDVKNRFQLSIEEVAQGVKDLCTTIQSYDYMGADPPKIILISPALVGSNLSEEYVEMFGEAAVEKSQQFCENYQKVAEELGIFFMDAASIVTPLEGEGIHWDIENHEKLGRAIAEFITNMCEI